MNYRIITLLLSLLFTIPAYASRDSTATDTTVVAPFSAGSKTRKVFLIRAGGWVTAIGRIEADSIRLADNKKIDFGTGVDATIYYDGTDLIINPAVVGTGDVVLNGGSLEFDDNEGVTLGTGKDATLRYDGTHVVMNTRAVGSGNFNPGANDGGALGTSGTGWSDLFGASGFVFNLSAGDVTLTHSAGKVTWGGDGAVEIDYNNHEMTNVDINSGAADGLIIGAASAAAGTFTTLTATGAFTSLGINDDANAVAITIDSDENVSVGVTDVAGFWGSVSTNAKAVISQSSNNTTLMASPTLVLHNADNTTNNLTQLVFGSVNTTPVDIGSAAIAVVHGARSTGWQSGTMLFLTTSGGSIASERMRITADGNVFIGDTANGNMTQGVTINQGENDNQALAIKSSDVAHALTSGGAVAAETDDYFSVQKLSATLGGAMISSWTENPPSASSALQIFGYGGEASTTPATTATALIGMYGAEHDGANALINAPANSLIWGAFRRVGGAWNAAAFIDAEGDIIVDGTDLGAGTFDDYPDYQVARAIRAYLTPQLFPHAQELVRKYGTALEDAEVVYQSGFFNLKRGMFMALDMGYQTGKKVFEDIDPRLLKLEEENAILKQQIEALRYQIMFGNRYGGQY